MRMTAHVHTVGCCGCMHPIGERAPELRDRKTQQFDVSGFAPSNSLLLARTHILGHTCTSTLSRACTHVDTTDLQSGRLSSFIFHFHKSQSPPKQTYTHTKAHRLPSLHSLKFAEHSFLCYWQGIRYFFLPWPQIMTMLPMMILEKTTGATGKMRTKVP